MLILFHIILNATHSEKFVFSCFFSGQTLNICLFPATRIQKKLVTGRPIFFFSSVVSKVFLGFFCLIQSGLVEVSLFFISGFQLAICSSFSSYLRLAFFWELSNLRIKNTLVSLKNIVYFCITKHFITKHILSQEKKVSFNA